METFVSSPLYAADDDQYDKAVTVLGDLTAMASWFADHLATMPAGLVDHAVAPGLRIGTFTRADFDAVADWLRADAVRPGHCYATFANDFARVERRFGECTIYVYIATVTYKATS